jgi:hypothetical protein
LGFSWHLVVAAASRRALIGSTPPLTPK